MIRAAITGPWRFAVYTISALAYYFLCYQTGRSDFYLLISLYAVVFAAYLLQLKFAESDQLVREGQILGIAFRCLLLFSIPHLSDDFYRFLWDGHLTATGVNPYLFKPNELAALHFQPVGNDQFMGTLYSHLNSKEYYSVYPPVCQFIFFISTMIPGMNGEIWMMRGFILLFEAGTILLLPLILKQLNVKTTGSLLYALNPLVIVELTGNIHFEAGMLFFLACSFYLLLRSSYFLSAICFGLAVDTKLLPLLFLPLFFRYIGFRKAALFSVLAGITSLLCFVPFLSSDLLQHISNSVGLYFSEFEYNASFYYLGKWLGGWNSLETKLFLQKGLPILTFIVIMIIAWRYNPKRFFEAAVVVSLIYFLLATTVHPWYIVLPVFLSSIVGFRSVIIWSGLIIFTYITYIGNVNRENFAVIIVEYAVFFYFLLQDLRTGFYNRGDRVYN